MATTAMPLDAAFLHDLSVIAQSESRTRRLVKYVRRLAQSKPDPTLMTKEEFFANIDAAREEIRQGKCYTMLPGESLDDFLKHIENK